MDMIVGVSDCISLALHHYLWLLEGAVTVWWPRSSWSFWGGRPFRLCPYLVLHLWMWIKCGDNFNYRFFWHATGALAAVRSHFHLEIIKTTARLRMGKGFQLSGTFDWLRLGTKSAERNCDMKIAILPVQRVSTLQERCFKRKPSECSWTAIRPCNQLLGQVFWVGFSPERTASIFTNCFLDLYGCVMCTCNCKEVGLIGEHWTKVKTKSGCSSGIWQANRIDVFV